MGLYLSGINMPEGEGSKLVLQIFPNGEVYDEHGIRLGITKWAEAISVPKHGRLVDADALYSHIKDEQRKCNDSYDGWSECQVALGFVNTAPTILETEEEK